MEVNDDGQMLVLSALMACLCLIGVAACISAIDAPQAGLKSTYLSGNTVDNILWAQSSGLKNEASLSSIYPWAQRSEEAGRFTQRSLSLNGELSRLLLEHGVAYQFSYNESLAAQYIVANPKEEAENIGGVLIESNGGDARVYGCAYDIFISDSISSYRVSRVETF